MTDCLTFILFGQRDLYSVGAAENKFIPPYFFAVWFGFTLGQDLLYHRFKKWLRKKLHATIAWHMMQIAKAAQTK